MLLVEQGDTHVTFSAPVFVPMFLLFEDDSSELSKILLAKLRLCKAGGSLVRQTVTACLVFQVISHMCLSTRVYMLCVSSVILANQFHITFHLPRHWLTFALVSPPGGPRIPYKSIRGSLLPSPTCPEPPSCGGRR
ncbi:LSM domain-containing protein [Perkinsela sp. CCAP 1560/4]|nr:LSM domain-containing protein [Perkinsela sp. CCAP 1560/4]|eukprot:KNH08464.1 LSM domain-containing protein [Perkinsela sp. CCAP 1560/4]